MSSEDKGNNKGKRLERMSDGSLEWVSDVVFTKKRRTPDDKSLSEMLGVKI